MGMIIVGGSSNVPTYTWATKPAAASNIGKTAWISDVGHGGGLFRATSTRWVPANSELTLFKGNWGTIAAPTLTRNSVGQYNIGTNPVIPGGLMQAGDEFEVIAMIRKNGTAGVNTFRVYLGTNTTTFTSNGLVYTLSPTTANDDQDTTLNPLVVVVSDTSFVSSRQSARGGGGGANSYSDQTASGGVPAVDFTANQTLSFELTTSASALDSIDLLYAKLVWRVA